MALWHSSPTRSGSGGLAAFSSKSSPSVYRATERHATRPRAGIRLAANDLPFAEEHQAPRESDRRDHHEPIRRPPKIMRRLYSSLLGLPRQVGMRSNLNHLELESV